MPISQNDREEAYKVLTNVYKVKHICSKQEYVYSLSTNVVYRCIHPIYSCIRNNIAYNQYYKEKEIAQLLNLEPFNKGYIKYLKGLCALEKFSSQPTIVDCTKKLIGDNKEPYLLRYLVCFEGEEVGEDIDEDWAETWQLFKPSRIVWIEESGYKSERNMCN